LKKVLDVLVQEDFELTSVPSRTNLFAFNNKSRIGANPMTQGFVNSERRLSIDHPDKETVFVELGQFSNPVRKLQILFF
jgi:hypothetical protein